MRAGVTALAEDVFLAGRGLLWRGRRYRCPVCGLGVRDFVRGGGSLRRRPRGYCPGCNAKARHRRVWLHVEAHTDWLQVPTRLLHVAPEHGPARRLRRSGTVDYESVDIASGPDVTTVASLTDLPHDDASFRGILCIHVLEHLDDDRAAMAEMYRVLMPGGIAVVNVPTDMDRVTYEDPTIVTDNARRAAFGEADHRRVYGSDLPDRLAAAGFEVAVHRADDLPAEAVDRHGLTLDEHVFHCRRPEDHP